MVKFFSYKPYFIDQTGHRKSHSTEEDRLVKTIFREDTELCVTEV